MFPEHTLIIALSVVLDGVLALCALFVASKSVTLARVGLAAAVVAVALLVPWLWLGQRISLFLWINVVYWHVFVLVPALGAIVLLRSRARPTTRTVRTIASLALALPPLGIWASFVEPKRLIEERTTVEVAPTRRPGGDLRIAVLSDIQCEHVTDHEREAVRRAMAFAPHLILMPGDLLQRARQRAFDEAIPEVRELLAPLAAPLGVYFVLGNCEGLDRTRELLQGTPVTLLENRIVALEHDGRTILVGGVDLSFDSAQARNVLYELQKKPGDELRLLIAHRPDVVYALEPNSRVDLIVAGHTHGGQVVVPFFGPLVTLSEVPRDVARGGLHELDGRRIYVSRGIGMERGAAPPVRFNCRPEVSLLTIPGAK
jgi:uncharacterized protein